MTDIYSKLKRSAIMSNISGKETKTEILVRKFLFKNGFRFKKNVKSLPGKPDIVLPKYKTIIFINGCFWHGHTCKRGKIPETNYEFWKEKISQNIKRDNNNILLLKQDDWNVIVIWQCEIKNIKLINARLNRLLKEIR
ncbi:MAG: DNA mismatch endonuclease Vsr [Endomicrobiaceae bacterium]|nr:DNA mismatch endonuclease Vsr [Endomicrobiaceae bacterium]MDD3106698.1 DNA mismatch endonuclease Vsr [Bacilli bacterium]